MAQMALYGSGSMCGRNFEMKVAAKVGCEKSVTPLVSCMWFPDACEMIQRRLAWLSKDDSLVTWPTVAQRTCSKRLLRECSAHMRPLKRDNRHTMADMEHECLIDWLIQTITL